MSLFGLLGGRRKDATKMALTVTGFAPNHQRLLQPLGVGSEAYWRDEYVLGFVGGCVMAIGLARGLKDELGPMTTEVLVVHSGLTRRAMENRYAELYSVNEEPFHGALFRGMDYAAFALAFGPDDHPFIKAELARARVQVESGEVKKILDLVIPDESPSEAVAISAALLDLIFMQIVDDRLLRFQRTSAP
jgi:hypothetical protein